MAHWHDVTRGANVAFGRRLREYRVAAGLSQPELARRSCMRYEFIGKMERGIGNPSLGTLALVADALGWRIADLFLPDTSDVVLVRAEDVWRAQEALDVLGLVLKTRLRKKR
jgi:transcriptional regulator with XRE-family HTH domain